MKLPKIPKKVSDFLIGEEGNISKEKLLKTGILLSALSLATESISADPATHVNSGAGHINSCPHENVQQIQITKNLAHGNPTSPNTHLQSLLGPEHGNVIRLKPSVDDDSIIGGTHCNGVNAFDHGHHANHGNHSSHSSSW